MTGRTRLTAIETVREAGSWLFTARDRYGELEEVLVVCCGGESTESGSRSVESDADESGAIEPDGGTSENVGVRAWVNRCPHEAQRLDVGVGAAIRDGEVVCPRHGSMFDACTGRCDNGPAAHTRLVSVSVTVEDGTVYLVDREYTFEHEGGIDDDSGGGGGGSGGDDGGGTDGDDGDSDDGDEEMPRSTSHIGL